MHLDLLSIPSQGEKCCCSSKLLLLLSFKTHVDLSEHTPSSVKRKEMCKKTFRWDVGMFKKNLNASKPSEHPPQVEECLKV